jgi:hypothetical protein
MNKLEEDKPPVGVITLKYKLSKPEDNRFGNKFASRVGWIQWKEDDRFKELHDEPAVNRSLILDPQYGPTYTWMTTTVTEILEQTDDKILFKTKNSLYLLEKIGDNGKQ